jgi:hypothetical protein
MLTGTYKEEYEDGSKGWHVERGASPKFTGGRWLYMLPTRTEKGDRVIRAYTHKTI